MDTPDKEIVEALRQLCEQISKGLWDGRPTNGTVRRLARPSLERELASLLPKYAKYPDVTAQLLIWVEQGKYASCGELALSLAQSATDPEVRLLAIRASAAATPSRRPDLVSLLKEENEYIRAVLLKALMPDHPSGPALTEFLCADGGHFMRHELHDISSGISTEDLDETLSAMLPTLCDSTVTARTAAVFSVAVPLTTARLARGVSLDAAWDTLVAIERLHHGQPDMFLMDSTIRDLDQLISSDSNMRHALWMHRFRDANHDALAFCRLTSPSFGNMQTADLEWLWLSAGPFVDARLADEVIDRIWCGLSLAERNRRLSESLTPALVEHLRRVSMDQEQAERQRDAEVAEITAKAEATRRENVRILAERRAAIETGDDFHALELAWNHLNGDSSDFSEVSAERLRKYVDDEYVQVFSGDLRSYWRKSGAFMTYLLDTVALLEEDLNERFGRGVRSSLLAPPSLRRWCTLLLFLVKRSEDIRHHGVYSPGPRDQAQDLRNRLLTALASSPTPEARDTLLQMREDPSLTKDRDAIDRLLAHQHQVAVEHLTPTWTEDDILRIERRDEDLPRTLAELFALVQSHLQHVGSRIANADFSYRGLFSKETKEREIQLWVAS